VLGLLADLHRRQLPHRARIVVRVTGLTAGAQLNAFRQ
jgi:hypothetical protein